MNYQKFFIQPLTKLNFIEDKATADAATKAVLGILVSAVNEEDARKLTQYLPKPLDLDRLRGMQASPTPVAYKGCVGEIARQFQLPQAEAEELTRQILIHTKAAVGETTLMEVSKSLSEDWRAALEHI